MEHSEIVVPLDTWRISGPIRNVANWPGRRFQSAEQAEDWARQRYGCVVRIKAAERQCRWILAVKDYMGEPDE